MLGMFGLVIRFSAMRTLGRFYSRNISIQGEHKLIQSGLYRYIRNPGYLGTLVTYLGFAVSTSVWLSVLLNLGLFFAAYPHRIKVEEQALVSEFGNTYKNYMERSWRLIPLLY
jgi:protein-S-isoprenylcysteine O-methyltransferase Ste14